MRDANTTRVQVVADRNAGDRLLEVAVEGLRDRDFWFNTSHSTLNHSFQRRCCQGNS